MSVFSLRAEPLVPAGNQTGECPVWDAANAALYWVDIPRGLIQRLNADGQVERWTAPMMIGAIALTEAGTLVAATERGFAEVTLDVDGTARLGPIADVLSAGNSMRFNDGAVDRQGRFWSGTMLMPPDPARPVGVLHRLDGDGSARPIVDGLLIQNGLAWSPDGRRMYLSDSHPSVRTIWRMDFDPETGTPSNRQVFCADLPGRPDGAAMDADGCYWIAATDAGKILRLTPEGKIDAEIVVPVPNPTNLCFGGPDLRTVFITSMPPKSGDVPMAGALFSAELPFAGLAEPRMRLARRRTRT
ncbi:SMP-30/gluconolactonase/LRE family protein [Devosia sediminis]|uniref:SMP-30/gluconolactonase/LRE family protein n=1 Tax=Devosia sediminis TaxID=2798801 RepID=A0A934MM69_9HYPH|nr:SMP-30/gluconolactonase/LRE family protein [Devosia sediminis]MBJ3785895.1 SMP-30/gluconolactonase/LRE family protein [Devosia sediminis]